MAFVAVARTGDVPDGQGRFVEVDGRLLAVFNAGGGRFHACGAICPHEDGPLSMLDVQLRPDGDGTRVDLYHEGRGIAGDPRGDQQHWEEALGRLAGGMQT